MGSRWHRFEHKSQPLLSRAGFLLRLAGNFGAAVVLVGVSLFVGMLGYHHFEDMACIDAFVNGAMILSGMGPMGELKTSGGKLFAGCYALYSGLILILSMGLILAPFFHRLIHKFHLASERDAEKEDSRRDRHFDS